MLPCHKAASRLQSTRSSKTPKSSKTLKTSKFEDKKGKFSRVEFMDALVQIAIKRYVDTKEIEKVDEGRRRAAAAVTAAAVARGVVRGRDRTVHDARKGGGELRVDLVPKHPVVELGVAMDDTVCAMARTDRMSARTKSSEQSASRSAPATCGAFIGVTFCSSIPARVVSTQRATTRADGWKISRQATAVPVLL